VTFDRARAVADAVLFEGYALYPYRPSSRKNMSRWQFGVLAPRGWAEDDGGESWWMQAECLVALPDGAAAPPPALSSPRAGVAARLRFLRLRRRRVLAPAPVPFVEVDGRLLVAWDEGDLCEIDVERVLDEPAEHRFELAADAEDETIARSDGTIGARVERRRSRIDGCVGIEWEPVDARVRCVKLRVRVENRTAWGAGGSRDEAMASSMLGAHMLLSVTGGEFVSLIDPPAWATTAAAGCKNVRAFPVLVGPSGTRTVALASPIILYDYPEVAPESPGDLFDSTEIDEILTLRTRALTDAEKREACASDARVAALITRTDALPDAVLERLHGALRRADGSAVPSFSFGSALCEHAAPFCAGDKVRLRPGRRPTDAQDMFFDGHTATVRLVMRDVGGRVCLAVTVDEDPAAELRRARGLFHYFYVDEVERVDVATSV
jgi:hypothetical protein